MGEGGLVRGVDHLASTPINGGLEGVKTGTYRFVGICFLRVAVEPTHSDSRCMKVEMDVV